MTGRELKTSVRLTDDQATTFRALAHLLGQRPHQLAACLVTEGLQRALDDPAVRPHLDVFLDVLTRQQAAAEARDLLDNVVDMHTRRSIR